MLTYFMSFDYNKKKLIRREEAQCKEKKKQTTKARTGTQSLIINNSHQQGWGTHPSLDVVSKAPALNTMPAVG